MSLLGEVIKRCSIDSVEFAEKLQGLSEDFSLRDRPATRRTPVCIVIVTAADANLVLNIPIRCVEKSVFSRLCRFNSGLKQRTHRFGEAQA